ncbi:hypothetical protein RsS93_16930 [Rhizobium dioscoreae]|uniref:Uncharacterized protein n=1 Tax=Rhizobium dioscoreae TaxID=2653122 RepID=A0ABQ0Z0R4_9HYPH|nr:hypothetical protein RsS93_16930 [Rhizobium dioscoreae]
MLALTQRRHEIQSFAVRQATIQHEDVIGSNAGHGIGIRNRSDMVGEHIATPQRFKQRAGHFGLILKQQNSQ